jgi:hypothetical protein
MFDIHALDDADIATIAGDPDTVRRILAAANLLTMEGASDLLGISYYRVKILRGRSTKGEAEGTATESMPRSDALPPALPLPGDPVWHRGEIETWGRQTGRIGLDGLPQRARPTGRPRKQRTAKAA